MNRRIAACLMALWWLAPLAAAQSRGQALDSLQRILAGFDQAGSFNGVVLIADSGRVVHHSAHGLAHRGYQVANRLDTKFNLASVGKTFTAVAIGQLVEQGRLKFSDTLARVLPSYPNQAVARRITIGQLLSHRSGMGLYWERLFAGNWTAVRTTKDLLPFFVDDTLLFTPGSRWFYSNTGFAVLAMVVEQVSGETYFDYVQKHILDPIGMANTGYYPLDQDVPNLAIGYFRDEDGVLRNNLFTHTVRGGGAGGGWSTAPDLLKWAEALRQGTVLGATIAHQMMTRQTDDDRGGGYGYGFIIQNTGGRTLVGHTGGFPGITTFFFMDPERDRVGVMMTNTPETVERDVWRQVNAYLTAPDR
jgi:CubicO group peptidase (beta-lactamase class C family)